MSVVITGMGVCTGQAENADQLWDIVSSKSPRPPFPKGGIYENDKCRSSLLATPFEKGGRGGFAVTEALQNAGLVSQEQIVEVDPERLGCTFSASKPLLVGEQVIPPDVIQNQLCDRLNIQGERRNVIAACATGAYSVALGACWIEQGLCDVVLAGSVEAPAHPLIKAGFQRMGVMSEEACMRPFDRHRSGFVLGEGAGAIVLESSAHAAQRGAPGLARLAGWGLGADGHSAVAFNSNGERIAQVIRRALGRAGLAPQAIGHVNAHGTATALNDWIETQALIKAFGPHAERLMISATKSSTGHLLGAAGSVELVLTVQALKEQYIPPTRNLEEPDPECALDYTRGGGHSAVFDHAVSLSFGFGGTIAALVVGRS